MIKLGYQLFHTFNMDHDNVVRCTVVLILSGQGISKKFNSLALLIAAF